MKKISVVTVTYNCKDTVEETIKSVIAQSYCNIEYIVVDGASNDGTIDIIKEYSASIQTLVCEPDRGIFDAMNKAVDLATGDYIIFINSGDRFVANDTIQRVFQQEVGDADLIYGDVYIQNHLGYKFGKADAIYLKNPTKRDLVFKSQGFCHQSLFTKTSILKQTKFNLEYKIGADYDTTARIYSNGNQVLHYTGFPIAVFDDRTGGASHFQHRQLYKERQKMFSYRMTILDKMVVEKEIVTYWAKVVLGKMFPKMVTRLRARHYSSDINGTL